MTKKQRPLQWLDAASAEEIGEALLSVDKVKAARVVAYLGGRVGPELERIHESVKENLLSDPLGSIGNALIGMSRSRK